MSAALSSFNDDEKAINEKLVSVDEKLLHASLADVAVLDDIFSELKEVEASHWSTLQQKCSWIITVPDVEGGHFLKSIVSFCTDCSVHLCDVLFSCGVVTSPEVCALWLQVIKTGYEIEKLKTKVEELVAHGRDVHEQQKAYDELRSELASHLEDIETKVQGNR